MKEYEFATVQCICNREVSRVPRAPTQRRCVCGMYLSFVQDENGIYPVASSPGKPLRAWNRRRILAAS